MLKKPRSWSATAGSPSKEFGPNGNGVLSRILNLPDQKDSLVGTIAEQVGGAIIEGRLAPGDDINSVILSRQFNTSRTPVREALLLLEKEGLVEILPRRRPRVAKLSRSEVRELYEVRASLYGLVAELIVEIASDDAIKSLHVQLDQMSDALRRTDLHSYFWANVAFQDRETTICGNSYVKRILDSLMMRILKLRYRNLSQPGRMELSHTEHQRLLRAYIERDAAVAVALKRGIVLRGLRSIEKSGWTGLEAEDGDNPQKSIMDSQVTPPHVA